MSRKRQKRRMLAALAAVLAVAATSGSRAFGASASSRLGDIVALSPAPEYRRAGTAGMAAVADYLEDALAASGYTTLRHDFEFRRWAVDYRPGHAPLVRRAADGVRFKTESAFNLGATTGAAGVDCTVRRVADVRPGDCGFVPFGEASPEWKNSPFVMVADRLAAIAAAGGIGAVVQGDVPRGLVFAMSARLALPTVVSVVPEGKIVGRAVRLRTMGSFIDGAPGRNVIGVLRPPPGSTEYVLLLAHADGWFQAAADNGAGVAAVLRAAERLAVARPAIGVIVGFMDAEEVGLIGSERFVEVLASPGGLAVPDGGPPLTVEAIKAVINLDAPSARASDVQNTVAGLIGADAPVFQWRVIVTSEEPLITIAGIVRFAAHGVLGLPVTASVFAPVGSGAIDGRLRSDVHHFFMRGVPFVWPVAGYPEYHTDGDTLGTVDAFDVEAIALGTAELAADVAALPLGRAPEPLFSSASLALSPPLAAALHDHITPVIDPDFR